jgi:hypothetical protein
MVDTQSTTSASSSRRSRNKPRCLPGASHYWLLESAQDAADDGRIGMSNGVCRLCHAEFTFFNSIVDYDPRANQQLHLGTLV